VTPDEAMTGPHLRQWAAIMDGEILFTVFGPDAEAMCRAAGETVAYRDAERPAEANGYQLHGPWIVADGGLDIREPDPEELARLLREWGARG